MVKTQGKKEIATSLLLTPTTEPANAQEGDMYYDSSEGLKVRGASSFGAVAPAQEWEYLGGCDEQFLPDSATLYTDVDYTAYKQFKIVWSAKSVSASGSNIQLYIPGLKDNSYVYLMSNSGSFGSLSNGSNYLSVGEPDSGSGRANGELVLESEFSTRNCNGYISGDVSNGTLSRRMAIGCYLYFTTATYITKLGIYAHNTSAIGWYKVYGRK